MLGQGRDYAGHLCARWVRAVRFRRLFKSLGSNLTRIQLILGCLGLKSHLPWVWEALSSFSSGFLWVQAASARPGGLGRGLAGGIMNKSAPG